MCCVEAMASRRFSPPGGNMRDWQAAQGLYESQMRSFCVASHDKKCTGVLRPLLLSSASLRRRFTLVDLYGSYCCLGGQVEENWAAGSGSLTCLPLGSDKISLQDPKSFPIRQVTVFLVLKSLELVYSFQQDHLYRHRKS